MRNLLYGCILVILGVFLAMGYDWATKNFVPSPPPAARPSQGGLPYPSADHLRENALRKYSEIPGMERRQLRESLGAAVTTLDSWLARIARSRPDLICVGESHDDRTRHFLASRFFSNYPIDVLMLETTPDELAILVRLIESGSPRLSMLDADVAEVVRATRQTNVNVSIHGIEESRPQRIVRFKNGAGSREESIFENFRAQFRAGERNLILYGALHCLAEPPWLFGRIRAGPQSLELGYTLSANVVSATGSSETEAFVSFLRELGLPSPPFVIPRTDLLHTEVYAWFPQLTQSFRQYDAVVVF